jgi:subtilisin family serine protease
MRIRMIGLAGAGLAMAGAAAGARAQQAWPEGGIPVESSFDPNGPFDNDGLVKTDAPSPHAAADWPFRGVPEDLDAAQWIKRAAEVERVRARNIPLTPAATPNYFMYWGAPFAMQLDTGRLAVQPAAGVPREAWQAAVAQAAHATNTDAASLRVDAHRGFVVLTLVKPRDGAAGVNDAIEALLASPLVEFAAPVFLSDVIPGGIAYPTPSVMARVTPALENAHLAVLLSMDPDLAVEWETLGTMPGAARLRSQARNGFRVMAQANALAANPAVKWAEPAFVGCAKPAIIVPYDPWLPWQHFGTSTGDYDMNSDWAWTYYGFGSSNVKVLILDSGIQTNHPDINQLAGRDFTNNLPGGSAGGGPDYDCDNHGTEVAGCVSMIVNNNAGGQGICPNCMSISGKVGYDTEDASDGCDPGWSWAADSTIAAIAWGVGQGVQMTNSSWSAWPHSPGVDDQMQSAAVTYGVFNVAATGNDSDSSIAWPASGAYCYAAGAVNSNGTRPSFSNYGTGIDFTAPGVSVFTTDRTGYAGSDSSPSPDGDYVSVNGTSFSSPLTAGLAAYLKSVFPFATRSQLYAMIRDGCQDSDTGGPGWDEFYGWGRIDAYNSAALNTPAGDSCGSPILITSATYNPALINTTWATAFPNEPQASCESGAAGESSSVFFWYITPSTGLVNVNTNGSNYDTVLSIWTGCGTTNNSGSTYTNPTALACDDDSGTGSQSQITDLWVDDAQVLLIKVSKYGTSAGGGNLDFNFAFTPAPPPNDLCADATVISLNSTGSYYYTSTYSTELATRSTCDGSETCGTANSNGHSVWYEFVPPVDGVVTIDTTGSNYNTVLHLYQVGSFACPAAISGNCILGPSLVACDDDSGTGTAAKLTNIGVSAGVTYKVKISGRSTAWGRLDFNLTFAPLNPPSNDACSAAAVLDPALGLHAMADLVTNRATRAFCDPVASCGDPSGDSNTVWYSITPVGDVLFTASTQGSNYDTVLSVWTGSCQTLVNLQCQGRPMTQVGCSDNISTSDLDSLLQQVPMSAGRTYRIMIADKNPTDAGGNLKFNYLVELPPPPPPACDPDLNQDGNADQDDVRYLVNVIAGGPNPAGTDPDFNADGNADQDDVRALVNVIAGGPCP